MSSHLSASGFVTRALMKGLWRPMAPVARVERWSEKWLFTLPDSGAFNCWTQVFSSTDFPSMIGSLSLESWPCLPWSLLSFFPCRALNGRRSSMSVLSGAIALVSNTTCPGDAVLNSAFTFAGAIEGWWFCHLRFCHVCFLSGPVPISFFAEVDHIERIRKRH